MTYLYLSSDGDMLEIDSPTQEQLEDAAGLDCGAIIRFENGHFEQAIIDEEASATYSISSWASV